MRLIGISGYHNAAIVFILLVSMGLQALTLSGSILNPLTHRRIKIGGPKYTELLNQGWMQYRGSLRELFVHITDSEKEMEREEPFVLMPTLLLDPLASGPQGFEDDIGKDLVFLNKPSGLNCVPARDLSIDSLSRQVLVNYTTAQVCHRLDRDTSGVVVFGLTKEAHRMVSRQFEERTTIKMYTALVEGTLPEKQGTVDLPIGKIRTAEGFNRWTINGEKARPAITEYRVEKVFEMEEGIVYSRVNLVPKTGRGHQLRLHMKSLGCPILGDTIHGNPSGLNLNVPRLCLHARVLQLDWGGTRLRVESVCPF